MAKKQVKTNAVRLIEAQKYAYELIEYQTENGQAVDGKTVARKIAAEGQHVFKTLVATAGKGQVFVFVIPVLDELDLKAAAKVAGVKKIEMLAMKDLLATTGYVRGGCSPIGMKKVYPTWFDDSAQTLDQMIVSAGKIGLQLKMNPLDLATAAQANFAAITVR